MTKTALMTALGMTLPPLAARSVSTPDWVEKVLGFHHLYDVPIQAFGSTDPAFNHMTNARVALRLALIVEEFRELFKDGFGIDAQVTLNVPDTLSKGIGMQFNSDEIEQALDRAEREGLHRNGAEVADASGDIVYVLIGMLIEMGYDLRAVLDEIHAANMTKLGPDGYPILREDGKVLKGPNYTKPNIPATLGFDDG